MSLPKIERGLNSRIKYSGERRKDFFSTNKMLQEWFYLEFHI